MMSQTQDSPDLPTGVRVGAIFVAQEALHFAVSRSSGPGGQNVNKQNTRIELRLSMADVVCGNPLVMSRLRTLAGHRITNAGELRIVCQQTRSLEQNRQQAIELLAGIFEEANKVPRPRRATKPTRGSRRRRVETKRRRSETKSHRQSEAPE